MRIAHLSDPHLLDLEGVPTRRLLLNKRVTGFANLKLKRGHAHRSWLVDAIIDDVRARSPDHVAITGDLTNLALEPEFERARSVIDALQRHPGEVSVVPGNHDVYTRGAHRAGRFMRYFGEYARSDSELAGVLSGAGAFPFLRVRGVALLVGLSTAVPRLPLVSSGVVGRAQREALLRALDDHALRDLTPVVLAHHPVLNPVTPLRRLMRGLNDADELCSALLSRDEVLSLHGHLHRSGHRRLTRGRSTLHILGATSASLEHDDPARGAAYNLYELDARGRLSGVTSRVWSATRRDFVDVPLSGLRDA